MKKFLFLLAFAGTAIAATAQDDSLSDAPSQVKYSVATNSFWSNWFVQANATFNSFYMDEDNGHGLSKSPFKSFRSGFGASFAFGKWFTPGMGLRTKVSGIWGKLPYEDENIKYWNLQEQALFNLSNIICGYNETRVWNFVPYIGFGTLRNCSANRYGMGASAGLLNTFRISKHVMLNLDVNATCAVQHFDGYSGNSTSPYLKSHDNIIAAEIGFTYNIGKSNWDRVPDVDAIQTLNQGQMDALNAQISDLQAENADLQSQLGNGSSEADSVEPAEQEILSAPVSVFFNIGQSAIASRKDLQNVKELATIAKDGNHKMVVTGYADSKTGNADSNKKLSEKRAAAVADELVKMGIEREDIEVVTAGGTNDLTPVSYNRRVTVEIK